MRRSGFDTEGHHGATESQWRGPESPKAFFAHLRAHPAHFHRIFAKWLCEAGFEIRWLKKQANRVWNMYLMRGSVFPGWETETAKEVITTTMKRCGVDYPKREIEVSVIGITVGVAFVFHSGTPGTLAFRRGREFWCADACPSDIQVRTRAGVIHPGIRLMNAGSECPKRRNRNSSAQGHHV